MAKIAARNTRDKNICRDFQSDFKQNLYPTFLGLKDFCFFKKSKDSEVICESSYLQSVPLLFLIKHYLKKKSVDKLFNQLVTQYQDEQVFYQLEGIQELQQLQYQKATVLRFSNDDEEQFCAVMYFNDFFYKVFSSLVKYEGTNQFFKSLISKVVTHLTNDYDDSTNLQKQLDQIFSALVQNQQMMFQAFIMSEISDQFNAQVYSSVNPQVIFPRSSADFKVIETLDFQQQRTKINIDFSKRSEMVINRSSNQSMHRLSDTLQDLIAKITSIQQEVNQILSLDKTTNHSKFLMKFNSKGNLVYINKAFSSSTKLKDSIRLDVDLSFYHEEQEDFAIDEVIWNFQVRDLIQLEVNKGKKNPSSYQEKTFKEFELKMDNDHLGRYQGFYVIFQEKDSSSGGKSLSNIFDLRKELSVASFESIVSSSFNLKSKFKSLKLKNKAISTTHQDRARQLQYKKHQSEQIKLIDDSKNPLAKLDISNTIVADYANLNAKPNEDYLKFSHLKLASINAVLNKKLRKGRSKTCIGYKYAMSESLMIKDFEKDEKEKEKIDQPKFKPTENDDSILNQWNFNLFNLQEFEKHRLIWAMFNKLDIFKTYEIDVNKFQNLLKKSAELYDEYENPYHNFDHAANGLNQSFPFLINFLIVVHCTYYFIQNTSFMKYQEEFDKLILLFSALMHDINHTGYNNQFEENTNSELAVFYNGVSVLENHHAATAFQLLKEDEYNIFEQLEYRDFKTLRKRTIANILATDMKIHFNEMKIFKEILDSDTQEIESLALSGLMIHLADLSSPSKTWKISQTWSYRCCQEFSAQNKIEEQLGYIPVTKYYQNLDDKQTLATGEYQFINFVCLPYWKLLNQFFNNELDMAIQNLEVNAQKWQKIAEREKEAKQEIKEENEETEQKDEDYQSVKKDAEEDEQEQEKRQLKFKLKS